MSKIEQQVKDAEKSIGISLAKTAEEFQKEITSMVEKAQEDLKKLIADSKLEIDNIIKNISPPAPVEITEVLPRWIIHTLHYPGDEQAKKVLDDYEEAQEKEFKRRRDVKKKLGRA